MPPRISMTFFAKFYESRPASQVSIVREIRRRMASPEDYASRDYYRALRNTLRQTHWLTSAIEPFENALDDLASRQTQARRSDHYRTIGHAYISHWRRMAGSFFPVDPAVVGVSGLDITVRPEVGVELPDGDSLVLKLWFNYDAPSRQARQIIGRLMGQARDEMWDSTWQHGIWDVPRNRFLMPLQTARDFELGLVGQVAAFQSIWQALEPQW